MVKYRYSKGKKVTKKTKTEIQAEIDRLEKSRLHPLYEAWWAPVDYENDAKIFAEILKLKKELAD